MNKREKKVLLDALEKYGAEPQMFVLFEEMGELMQALSKVERTMPCDITTDLPTRLANVAEEIADVQIMLDQMILLFDAGDAVEEYRNAKLLRLERRVKEGEQNG